MKKIFIALFSICTVLILVSCGSKPAPEEEKKQPPVIEKIEEPEPEQIENKDDLSALMEKIDEARNVAIQEGADRNAPDLLNSVDNLYEQSKESGLESDADSLVERYNLLAAYAKAKNAKNEIDKNNLAGYAQRNYDAGAADLQKTENALKSSEKISTAAKNSADSAIANFNAVISAAYKRMAKDQRNLAYEAKVNADSVKAGVSQKEKYKIAADDFKNGDALYSMQNPQKALEKYTSATQKFTELYEEVYEKRAAAQAAIEAAKKKVLESSEYAANADRSAPISEKIDGIEDEETVLLEEDDYENPDAAEVEIAETIDDEEEFEIDENSAEIAENENPQESDEEYIIEETVQEETEVE